MSTERPWLFCQLGAREHYVLPRGLHRRGRLRALITEAWARPGGMSTRVPGALGRRFADRFASDLADARVEHFTGASIAFELAERLWRRPSGGWATIMRRNDWFERNAVARIESGRLLEGRPAVFAYSYAALGILRAAKAAGCTTVLGQIDPAITEENIVAAAVERHAAFDAGWKRAPEAYWTRWREECTLADRIVVNSRWAWEGLVAAGIDSAKLAVVPLAYEGERNDAARSYPERFTAERPLRVLFLGSLVIRKGIVELLEAAALLADAPVEFHLVGREAIDFPASVTANPKIIRHGAAVRGDVAAHYAAADVFILPSLSDGFGLTQIEAQAHGLPVIASRHCGEVVRDGENGLLLDEVSGRGIAVAIRRCLDDPAALARHSAEASRHLDRFAPAAVIDQLIDVIDL